MKKKPTNSVPIPFPVPVNGSALSSTSPPSVPAFPVGLNGSDIIIAVPVLLLVPTGKGEDVGSDIGDAVAIVRSSEVLVSGVPVECISLANSDGLHCVQQPATRARFLSLMSDAIAAASESMASEGGHDPDEIAEISSEALEVLCLLNASGVKSRAIAS